MKLPANINQPPQPQTGRELFQMHVAMPHHAEILRKEAARAGRFPLTNGRRGRMVKSKRMYDGATTTSTTLDFPVTISSADNEIFTSLIQVRSRARRLCRDNPYASGAEMNMVANVCGDEPYRLEMKVGKWAAGKFEEETETNREITEWWKEAGLPENCTTTRDMSRSEFYWMAIASAFRDGSIYARHRRAFPYNEFGYAVQPLEADYLDPNYNRAPMGKEGEIRFSIERDEFGGATFYHVLTRHPGDVHFGAVSARYREKVPADQMMAFHAPRLRGNQTVGMSKFASVLQRLHRIEQYDIAEMTAAIVCAIKIGFFTKTNTSDEYVGDAEEDGMMIDKVEPGMNFEEMPDNFDLKQFDPKHPVEAYSAFTDQNLRSVAVGLDQSHSGVSGNYGNMSFSTGRLEKQPERDNFKLWQKHMKTALVQPHFCEALKYAILSGRFAKFPLITIDRLKEFCKAAKFHARRWPYISPLEEVQAAILRKEAGLDSAQHIIAESERGGSFEDVCIEQAADNEMAEEHDLDFANVDPTTPPKASVEGGETPPPRTGGKQTIKKARGVNYVRLERTLRFLDEHDPEFKKEGHLTRFLDFKKNRNGHLLDS